MKEHLDHYTCSVEVQFSGNAKTYHFLCNAAQYVAAQAYLARKLDTRVVVPGKIRDRRLSLSIANVLSTTPTAHAGAEHAIVEILPPLGIDIAMHTVLLAEQRAANNPEGTP